MTVPGSDIFQRRKWDTLLIARGARELAGRSGTHALAGGLFAGRNGAKRAATVLRTSARQQTSATRPDTDWPHVLISLVPQLARLAVVAGHLKRVDQSRAIEHAS